MTREFSVVIERDAEGTYVGTVPALKGCHTQARSLDDLRLRIREAAELCLSDPNATITPLEFVGVHLVTVDG